MTTETKEYAQLAARVYKTTDANKLESPFGWETLEIIPDPSDGFSAGVFRRIGTSEIVIAYTGTNANKITDIAFGNLPATTGQPSSQALKAMLLYERIKNTPGYGDNISFTGHSLGGGLASLMAVYFNKPATTFDAAPFQLSALNSSTLNYYKNELSSRGYVDSNFNQYNDATYPLMPSTFSVREANVTGYHLQGEFLNPMGGNDVIYGGADNDQMWGDVGGKTSDADYLDWEDGNDKTNKDAIELVAVYARHSVVTGLFDSENCTLFVNRTWRRHRNKRTSLSGCWAANDIHQRSVTCAA